MVSRDLFGALLFLLIFTLYSIFAWQIPLLPFEEYEVVTSATMPKIYGVLGMIICLISVGSTIIKNNTSTNAALADQQLSSQQNSNTKSKPAIRQTLLLIGLMILYAIGLEPAGFIVATLVFLTLGFYIMGEKRKKILFLATVPVVLLFWLLMTQVLDIYLSAGTLWE